MAGRTTNSGTTPFAHHLHSTAVCLIQASLTDKSRQAYLRAWQKLVKYWSANSLNPTLPLSATSVVNYLAIFFEQGYAATTIASHNAVIAFTHTLLGYQSHSDSFIVNQFLRGTTKLVGSPDSRLPITKPILVKLLNAIPRVVKSIYSKKVLQAVFALAFAGFLRLGGLCLQSGYEAATLVQMSDVEFSFCGCNPVGISISLYHFKHKQSANPVNMYIPAAEHESNHCPVKLVFRYLQMYKNGSSPLFQLMDRTPVPYTFIGEKLQLLIRYIGLDVNRYKPHSFRIGAACSALMDGYSEDDIRKMGRWKSSAVKNYIRLPILKL